MADKPPTQQPPEYLPAPPTPAYPMQPQQYPTMTAPVYNPMAIQAAVGEQYHQGLFAQCATGNHDRDTKYGACGIITAVICFPIGLLALFIDREVRCARCSVRLG